MVWVMSLSLWRAQLLTKHRSSVVQNRRFLGSSVVWEKNQTKTIKNKTKQNMASLLPNPMVLLFYWNVQDFIFSWKFLHCFWLMFIQDVVPFGYIFYENSLLIAWLDCNEGVSDPGVLWSSRRLWHLPAMRKICEKVHLGVQTTDRTANSQLICGLS